MTLQPLYGSDAAHMVPMLLSNFSDVAAAVQQAASELRSGNQAILQSLAGRGLIQTAVSAQHGETQHEASLTRQESSECLLRGVDLASAAKSRLMAAFCCMSQSAARYQTWRCVSWTCVMRNA